MARSGTAVYTQEHGKNVAVRGIVRGIVRSVVRSVVRGHIQPKLDSDSRAFRKELPKITSTKALPWSLAWS